MMTQLLLSEYRREFDALLPAEALDGNDATKDQPRWSISWFMELQEVRPTTIEEAKGEIKGTASIEIIILCSRCVYFL